MTHTKQVESLFGPDAEKYFINKQMGGNSNQKGSRYEDFFSVMQLAQLFQLLTNNDDKDDIEIYAQAEAFVDDLLIKFKRHNSQHHFRLKSSLKVNWGTGLKSIGDDFYKQKTPDNIANFTEIIFFPEVDTINHLILIEGEFKTILGNICFSNDIDKLEALAKLILAHWVDKKTTLSSVNELLSTLENTFPNYLARSNVAENLLPEVERIFSMITHFSFKIEKGYFSWQYHDFDSGTIPYSVDSKEFIAFQQEIASKCPRQFDELEGILL